MAGHAAHRNPDSLSGCGFSMRTETGAAHLAANRGGAGHSDFGRRAWRRHGGAQRMVSGKVRERIITEIEHATGGARRNRRISFRWEHLTATVAPLVLHGTEPAGEAPLFSAVGDRGPAHHLHGGAQGGSGHAARRTAGGAHRVLSRRVQQRAASARTRKGVWTEDLLNLPVRRYEVVDGILEYDDRADSAESARRAAAHRHELTTGAAARIAAKLDPALPDRAGRRRAYRSGRVAPISRLKNRGIEIPRLRVSTRKSRADLAGTLSDLRGRRAGVFA